jgi:hypothetical protein
MTMISRVHPFRSLLALTAVVLAVFTAGCVQSKKTLISDAKPLMGASFEAHFFENFIEGKASVTHTAFYRWKDDRYVIVRGSDDRVAHFKGFALGGDDFVVEGAVKNASVLNYWVARKVVDGVFLIVPVNEADSDAATRTAACTGKGTDGNCFVEKRDELVELAKATAAKALRNPTLGVLVLRQEGT